MLASDIGPGHFFEVDLDDPFFRTIPIVVAAPGDFQQIGMQRIDARLTYGRASDPAGVKEKNFTFAQDDPREQRHSFSLNQRRDLAYEVQVDFNFDPQSGWRGQRDTYRLPVETTLDRTLMINPYDHFEFRELRLVPGDLDASAVVSTDVRLSYTDRAGFSTSETFTVMPGGETQTWKLRLAKGAVQDVTYAVRHHLVDGSEQAIAPRTTDLSSITINDPFPDALKLDFIPSFEPGAYRRVFADVLYVDAAHNYRREETLLFEGDDPQRQSLRIALFDRTRRKYRLTYTIQGNDGSIRRLEQDTQATRLFVGETF